MLSTVRPAAVAGSWYPGSASVLAAEIDSYLEAVPVVALPGRLLGLVSPHAGLRYSGSIAAHGYAQLRGRGALTAVLVGPSHRVAFDGVAVHARGAWDTPLGRVPIDERATAALLEAAPGLVRDDAGVHVREHALEMQLPFLQRLAPAARIVPLIMGSQSLSEIDGLAAALASALRGHECVLVASSDLSHYQPAPIANRLDAVVVGHVARFDEAGLVARLQTDCDAACGGGPIAAVMKSARALGADRSTVLKYGDSGDAEPHDKSHVVGYLSAAFSASPL